MNNQKGHLSAPSNQADKEPIIKDIEALCSSADLLFIYSTKLEKAIKQAFANYPEMANQLLQFLALLDNIIVRIKHNAIKIGQNIDALNKVTQG